MREEMLIHGYVLRIAVVRHRWRISLFDPVGGEVRTFDSFLALSVFLERSSTLPQSTRAPSTARRAVDGGEP